jgi:hypothetical protein
MTTYELKDYRLLLERALGDNQIGRAPIPADIQARLDQVRTEEEQRQRIRRDQRNGTHSL